MADNGTIEISLKGNRRFRVKREGDKWRVAVKETRDRQQRIPRWYEAADSALPNAVAYVFDRLSPNREDREIAEYLANRFDL